MKHILRLTVQKPLKADAFQDIFCQVNATANELLQFKGGTNPIKDFADDQCDLNPPS